MQQIMGDLFGTRDSAVVRMLASHQSGPGLLVDLVV